MPYADYNILLYSIQQVNDSKIVLHLINDIAEQLSNSLTSYTVHHGIWSQYI